MPLLIESLRPRTGAAALPALVAIIALAFVIRISGIDWDQGRYLHPDERHIVADVLVGRIEFGWPPSWSWLDPETSPINPRPLRDDGTYSGFAYGTLPVYAVDIIGNVLERVTGIDWGSYERSQYIGRALSILFDTGTVLLVYLIGARLLNRAAGLVGAAIYAFLPLAIQASHFFIVDSWMTFFIVATLYTCMNALGSGSAWQLALASSWWALAVASKTTAAPLGGIILLTLLVVTVRETERNLDTITLVLRAARRMGVCAISFLIVYFIGEPFAFLDPQAFLDSFRTQAEIQSGTWDVPFTQQYVGTLRGAYHLKEAVRFSLGPVATLLGIAGALGLPWLWWRRGHDAALLLAAWIAGFAIVILVPETKFPRYTLPIAPALSVTAAVAIVAIATYLRRTRGSVLAATFTAAMLLVSTGYGAAFAHVTSSEHTRISASIWIQEHLPPGSTMTSEIWDDRLPISVSPGHSSDARRTDDSSINLYVTTPTLGDIAELGPAMENLPHGQAISGALTTGDVEEAVSLLRSITTVDLAATSTADTAGLLASRAEQADADAVSARIDRAVQFRAALERAWPAMTTSADLAQQVRAVSRRIEEPGVLTVDDIRSIADAIENASDASMLARIYSLLTDADYYVLASDRVQRGMDQNPWRYGVQACMYELLESGELGFTPLRTFESSPTLFGIEFPDQSADETFINYDHPVVRVYEKHELVDWERFVSLFGSAALAQTDPTRSPDPEPLTFDTPVSDLPAVDDSRWSEPLTGNSWGATLVWIVMLVLIQLAGWPIVRTIFRKFPDHGWAFSKLISIIVPATTLWWLASFEILQFRSVWVVVSMALFALAAWLWFARGTRLRERWSFRTIMTAEGIFWVTFLLFLAFKMVNPDSWHLYWGGEKPMEFAQINAILRSPHFPPVDPWYAQGFINYYYYSFYLVAFLIKLTGVPPEYAFNLAQPTVMAILASGVFSVGTMLGNRITRGRQTGIFSGLLAVALVSFAGNMMSAARVVEELVGSAEPFDAFLHWVWDPSRAIIDRHAELNPENQYPTPVDGMLITEFPYFTGLYGDLHSHVVGMPLIVLCIALAASFAIDPDRRTRIFTRFSLARLLVCAISLGIIYPTNAWDLPVTAALVGGGVLIGSASVEPVSRRIAWVATSAGGAALGAVLVTFPFLLHFEALFGSIRAVPATTTLLELETHLGGLLLVATASIPAIFLLAGKARRFAPPAVQVAILGFVLLLRWLAVEVDWTLLEALDIATVAIVATIWLGTIWSIRPTLDLGLPSASTILVAVVGAIAVIGLIVADNLVAALYASIAATGTGVWLMRRSPAIRLLALLVAGAGFIGAGVEIVFLVDDLAGSPWARMNTIFKFYNQVWILLGIAGASAAGVLVSNLYGRWSRGSASSPARDWVDTRLGWSTVATVVTAIVLTLSTAFPITATGIRLQTRFEPRDVGLTLDAYAWMEFGTVELTDGTVISFDEDLDVINWFNEEVEGTPVIAEAAFEPYRCNSSRISNATGLPSVLGWLRHQRQQRYQDVLEPRNTDLRLLYASEIPETKLEIIHRYDIHYIVVGELERSYPMVFGNDCVPMSEIPQFSELDLEAGIAAFEQMEGDTLEIAFQSGDTVVYRVTGNG